MFPASSLQGQAGSQACPRCVYSSSLCCYLLCAQSQLPPTPGSLPASPSKEARLNQVIYSPNQKGNNVYNLQSSQVLAPTEAGEGEIQKKAELSRLGSDSPVAPCFGRWAMSPTVQVFPSSCHDQKEKKDKARGQAQTEAVDNVRKIDQGYWQKGGIC